MANHADFLIRFAETVAARPNAVAVEATDGTLTYAELDRISNRLARKLQSLGIGRECTVGISLRRGGRELVGLLGICKAGAGYVPMDPTHPIARLSLIMQDAGPRAILAESDSPLLAGAMIPAIHIEAVRNVAVEHADAPLDAEYSGDQLAYVLFTSGSTGRPKGVEITRGAFANFLQSMAHTPGIGSDDRLFAITTTSFDIAGLELFLPLWAGATVVIADQETARDPRLIRKHLERDTTTIMQATPAMWRLLVESGWSGNKRLKMLCGGEALSVGLADKLLERGGELWNLYGPTETTVWSTVQRIEPGYDRITIGRPIDNTQVYLLDEARAPVPVGKEGEIWIGGSGLARAYRGRPDLTQDRFIQNPQGPPGDRIYRTGDLGRELPDGRIECLGRIDHQVKIRGFRVELGEIEAVLRSVPGVKEALVVANQSEEEGARLIAYWIGDANREQMHEIVRGSLPLYMNPAGYIQLTAFPLTSNGKIDRAKLPTLKEGALRPEPAHTRPLAEMTEAERRVASVWCDVLGLREVPVDRSFFELGGTSVLALQVIARLEQELNVDIPLQIFFETPTVTAIAARIGKDVDTAGPVVVWLQRGKPEVKPLFCLFGVTIYKDLAVELGGDRPIIGMHIPFRYVPQRDKCPTLEEIAAGYLELIRTHQPKGPYRLLGLCFGGVVAYEVARQLEALGETVESVTILDAVLPSAITTNQVRRMLSYAQRLWHTPAELVRRVRDKVSAKLNGVARKVKQATSDAARPVDVAVDGDEMLEEVRLFSSRRDKLSSRLLVIRATAEPTPSWMSVQPDHGWGDRASEVLVRDVAADHLGVLRAPCVRVLASAMLTLGLYN